MKYIILSLLIVGQAFGQSRQKGDTILIQTQESLTVTNIVTGEDVTIHGQLFEIVLDPIGGIFNDPPTFKDIVPKKRDPLKSSRAPKAYKTYRIRIVPAGYKPPSKLDSIIYLLNLPKK